MANKILRDVIDIQRFAGYLGHSLGNGESEQVFQALVNAPDADVFIRHVSSLGLTPHKIASVEDALCLASMAKRR